MEIKGVIKKYWEAIMWLIFLIPSLIGFISTIHYENIMYGIIGVVVGLLFVVLIIRNPYDEKEML